MSQHHSTETPEILALQTAFQSIAKSVATSIVDALVQPLQQEIESKVNAIIAEATKDIHNKIAAAICRDLHLKSVRPAFSAFLGQH